MAIQVRRGANANFDKSKMLPGEFAVTTDGTRKVYAAFASNDVKELASKDDVQNLINSFSSVVDREIAEAEQRIESKGQEVLDTIPDLYETVSAKADEAVRTKADAIVCSASGVDIVVNDSSDDYLRNLKLYGKTTQPTTSGKNLLPRFQSITGVGITMTVKDDGKIVLDGTATSDFVQPIYFDIPDGTYSFSINNNKIIGSSLSSSVYIALRDSNNEWLMALGCETENNQILAVGCVDIASAMIAVPLGVTVSNLELKPQIEKGSVVTEYEPYTGGIASPSPSYPQPLESVGKWGNYFDISQIIDTAEIKNNGNSITVTTTAASSACLTGKTLAELAPNLELGKEYVLSFKTTGSDNYIYLGKEAKYIANGSTFSVTQNTLDSDVYLYASGTNTTATISEIMLNEGTTALPYRPYSGQMEIESGVYGKNLTPVSSLSYVTYDEKTGTINSITTNNTSAQWAKIMLFKNSTNVKTAWYGYDCILGLKVVELTKDDTFNLITVGFNGNRRDSHIFLDCSSLVNGKTYKVVFNVISLSNNESVISGIMVIDKSITDYTYTPYAPKQSHISLVGDGLKGIPVTNASLATYTDENGQMWCSDYVDCDRGVLVQRCIKLSSAELGWFLSNTLTNTKVIAIIGENNVIGEHNNYSYCNVTSNYNYHTSDEVHYFVVDKGARIYVPADYDVDANPIEVIAILATPIETPLSSSEIESYKALRSNYKVTTVMNDCVAFTELKYNADTETWINNAIDARIAKALSTLS